MKLHYLLAMLLLVFGTSAFAFDDSDGGGYEAPDTDPEVSDRDQEVDDRDCEDCDPVTPEPEPEPEPALDNGRDGDNRSDPYNGR